MAVIAFAGLGFCVLMAMVIRRLDKARDSQRHRCPFTMESEMVGFYCNRCRKIVEAGKCKCEKSPSLWVLLYK